MTNVSLDFSVSVLPAVPPKVCPVKFQPCDISSKRKEVRINKGRKNKGRKEGMTMKVTPRKKM